MITLYLFITNIASKPSARTKNSVTKITKKLMAYLYGSPGTEVTNGYSLDQAGLYLHLYTAAPLLFFGLGGVTHGSSSTSDSSPSTATSSSLLSSRTIEELSWSDNIRNRFRTKTLTKRAKIRAKHINRAKNRAKTPSRHVTTQSIIGVNKNNYIKTRREKS